MEDMELRTHVEAKMRTTFHSFGYRQIQTPTFEHLDLFTMKSGESIIDEIYSFTDKGGRNLALRPELTAPVIRMYIERMQMESKPLKVFYFGNCYRYDRPQKGRYREFMQAGCELIGTNTAEALAELIGLAYHLLIHLNISDIHLEIGNLTLLKMIFSKLNIDTSQQRSLLPLIDKEQFDDASVLLSEFGFTSDKIDTFLSMLQESDLDKLAKFFTDNNDAIDEIEKMKQMLHFLSLGLQVDKYQLNLGIVRGLDYYMGMVFEIKAPRLGAEKQLCGGGEYQLIPLFNGRETPTSGFALGFDRTILAMEMEKISLPPSTLDYFIIPVTDEMIDTAAMIAMKLRKQNYRVDMDLMRRGMKKALKYADNRNTKLVIICGPDEVKQHQLSVKDMKTGEQGFWDLETLLPIETDK